MLTGKTTERKKSQQSIFDVPLLDYSSLPLLTNLRRHRKADCADRFDLSKRVLRAALRVGSVQTSAWFPEEDISGVRNLKHHALWSSQEIYRVYNPVNGGRKRETDLFESVRRPL